jgi:cyclopropane-fatty-acyl-phospholipid synthase
VRLRCWDGSEFVPPGDPAASPVVELRSPDAVRRLLWHPGELGAAQAYVTGELDVLEVDGWDLDKALTHSFAVAAERGLSGAPPRSSRRCAPPSASARWAVAPPTRPPRPT